MSIFQTDKLIILYYRPGAGGKFLANCLGLSSQVVLQDADFAQQQLDGKLDTAQKFNHLISRLDDTKVFWKDLGLGDYQYFGLPGVRGEESQLKPICKKVHDQKLFFVAALHNITALEVLSLKWPNAKIINFVNSKNFLTAYRKVYLDKQLKYWNQIKSSDWPETPPGTVKEIRMLPQNIQDTLKKQFQNEIYSNIEPTTDDIGTFVKSDQLIFTWDCDWYNNEESTAQSIENIYNLLGLTDFNPTLIKLYWNKWIEKLHLPPEEYVVSRTLC